MLSSYQRLCVRCIEPEGLPFRLVRFCMQGNASNLARSDAQRPVRRSSRQSHSYTTSLGSVVILPSCETMAASVILESLDDGRSCNLL